MNFDEFKHGFDKLVQAFSPSKPDEKSKIYFEELKRLNALVYSRTCSRLVRESEKFPTIAKILQTAESISPSHHLELKPCMECDGRGLVSKWNHTFRARCEHGYMPSKIIALVPLPEEEEHWKPKLNDEWRMIYGQDLLEVQTPEAIQKAKEMFGMSREIKPLVKKVSETTIFTEQDISKDLDEYFYKANEMQFEMGVDKLFPKGSTERRLFDQKRCKNTKTIKLNEKSEHYERVREQARVIRENQNHENHE